MSPRIKGEKPHESKGRMPLLWMVVVVAVGYLLVLGARVGQGREIRLSDLLPLGVWGISVLVLAGLWSVLRFGGSHVLAASIVMLSGIGLLVRSRMSGAVEGVGDMSLWIQPLGFAWLGLGWFFCRRGRIETWKPFWPLAALLGPLVIAGLLALGNRFRGAFYGPGGMTPSETLKVLIPFALAGALSTHAEDWKGRSAWNPPIRLLLGLGLFWGLMCVLLVLQRDLGMVVLLSIALVGMLVAVSGSTSWGVVALALGGAGLWAAARFFAHGARRIEAWLNPFADPTGTGWQVLQGLTGLYSGGLAGTGFGAGRPDRLPIADSDFVYAVYGEETGYLGCLLLLGLYAILLRAALKVATRQQEDFAFLVATGLAAVLAAQVIVNLAGVVTLLPITGIPLPYISAGGSSFWVTSLQFGILLGLSDTAQPKGDRRKRR